MHVVAKSRKHRNLLNNLSITKRERLADMLSILAKYSELP
ncbi:hypothetical protein PLUTE_b1233 [Pseudoalteromonas luteoviolacea DSM 6061]|nr:hypothetical protein [Pseudoalteromonas luteoviolacea DSM 6061]